MKLTGCCAALIMLVVASGAIADLPPVGGFGAGGSWGQRFHEYGVGEFDTLRLRWETLTLPSPEGFAPRTFRGLLSDWAITDDSPTQAIATGAPQNDMTWSIWFTGDSSEPLAFDFAAFLGEQQVDHAYVYWSGTDWSVTTLCWTPPGGDVAVVVPVPAATLLGFLGLGAAGLKLRKLA